MPRADRDEHTQGVGTGGTDVLRDDLQTGRQHCTADGAIQLGKASSSTAARNHRNQRQRAAIINLIDLDLNLLSDAEHILNILNPLATGEWTQLGDVQ